METVKTPRLYKMVGHGAWDKDLLPVEGRVELPVRGRVELHVRGRVELPVRGRVELHVRGRVELPVRGRVKIVKQHHQTEWSTKNYNGSHLERDTVGILRMALLSESVGYRTT